MSFPVDENNLLVKSVTFQMLHKEWLPVLTSFNLSPEDIHLWKVPLAVYNSLSGDAVNLVTQEERHAVERMSSEKRKREYVVSKVVIKCLAGKYLDVEPQSVVVRYTLNEKPEVITPGRYGEKLCFSWSHCHDMFVCGIARQAVGVDVELINNIHQHSRVKALLRQWLPDSQTDSIDIVRYWTACEALYKRYSTGTLRDMLRDEKPFSDSATTSGYHLSLDDYIIAVAGHKDSTIHCYGVGQDSLLIKV